MSLLPVEEAQARLLALASPLERVSVPLGDAMGRWLAEPLIAQRDQPWTDLSAMDGYAIRHADLPGPWMLAGESSAGGLHPEAQLATGQAIRIFTGAPLPLGADTVMVQEDVSADGTVIRLSGDGPAATGQHVRRRASDFAKGAPLLAGGSKIGPAQIGLAALAGNAGLIVHRQPRIAILSTGNELVSPGAPCPPGKLPASNGIMLDAMVRGAGGHMLFERLVPDDLAMLTTALQEASEADIIVTSGGASVGDHDLVRPALEAAGGQIDFWKIAMRPGKPLIVGRLGKAIVLGLPGNPVASMVTGGLFLLPLIRHLAGCPAPLPQSRRARLGAAMPEVGARTDFVRATLDEGLITPLGLQDSAAMHAAAQANALIIRPARAPAARDGDDVSIMDWASLGLA